jgi:hypothetical protein
MHWALQTAATATAAGSAMPEEIRNCRFSLYTMKEQRKQQIVQASGGIAARALGTPPQRRCWTFLAFLWAALPFKPFNLATS